MVKKPEKKKVGNLNGAKNSVGEETEQNHRLFDNMAEGYAYCRMIYEKGQAQDWVYISVNKSFERLTGLKEVGGKRAAEVTPDLRKTYPGLFEACSRVSQKGQPEKIELFVESLQTWFSVSVFSPETGFFAAIFDVITERKKVEEKLRESRERFRTVANFTYDWEYWLDDNRQILYTSPSCERITGYGVEKFEQDPSLLEKIIHHDDRPLYKRHIQEEIGKAEPISLDFRIITTGGDIRWISHACQPVHDMDGRPMGRRASNRDITQRRQIEQALRESESILSMSEEVAQMGSWRLDLRTKKVAWSDQMFSLFEVEREDFDGDMNRVIAQRVHPDDATAVLDFNRSILTGISSVATLTYRIVLPGGKERTLRTHGKLVCDDAGRPVSMTGYVREITEWVKVKNQLVQMNRLHATLSHVNQILIRAKDTAELYPSICDAVVKYGELAAAWIEFLDKDSRELCPVAANGLDVKKWPLPIVKINGASNQNGVIIEALRTSRVATSEDVQTDERTKSLYKYFGKFEFHSLASIPLRLQGKTIGILNLVSGDVGLFKAEEEISLLEEMGLDISFALEKNENEKIKRRWAEAFEHCAHGIAIGLPTGLLITCNTAFARQQGRTAEEISSMSILDMYEPSAHEYVGQRITEADDTGHAQYEANIIRKDGSIYSVQTDLVSVHDENGRLLYRVAAQQDVSGRKHAEDALRESEEKMRSIFRAAPTGIGVVRNRVLLDVNSRICEMTGYTIEELVGQSARIFYPTQEEFEFVGSEKYQQIAQKGTGKVETRWQKKDGSIIDVLLASTPIDLSDLSRGVTFTALDITDRKRAEEALRESEDKFKYVFDNSVVAKSITEVDGRLHANRAFCEMVGYSEQELSNKPWREITHPDDIDLNLRELNEILAGEKETARFIKRYIHKSGSVVWVDLSTSLRRDVDGTPLYFLTTALDITERKRAEEELRQSEERFELAMLAVNDGIWDWNIAEDRLYFDPRYYTLADYEPNEFPCAFDEWRNRIHPDDVENSIREVNAHLSGQTKVFDIEFRFLRKGGTWMWIRGRGKAVQHDANGKVSRMIGTHTDITDRKRAEEAIRQSERQMKALVASLDDIVFEFDEDGTYLDIWTADESLLALPKAEMLGKRVLEVMGGEHGPRFADAIKRVSASSDPESIEYPLDVIGGRRWFMARINPILAPGSTHGTVSVLVRDITERKRVEDQVQIQLRRMRALNEIDRAISSSMDMRLSLDILLNEVLTQLEVDAAAVLLLNPTSQTLEYMAGKGFHSLAIRESRALLGQDFPGRAGLERRTLHVPNLDAAGELFLRRNLLKDEKFVEYYGIPLIAKGLLKGVLEIFHRTHLKPDLDWLNYLETLGGQAAIAIDNAQLFEGMQRSNLELVTSYDATIEGWSHAMDLRDKETEGHTQRVSEWTVKLAKKMGVSQQEITHMRRGALLHDIGKLGIPDHILHKPDILDQNEWEIMHEHPTYAFNMLASIHYLRPALDIPYCHHEKWDGSGYPRGLKGEEIPMAARIFAIVDVWDALRSDRPYRKGWTTKKIREHLIAEADKHFDPRVVRAFLELLDKDPSLQ